MSYITMLERKIFLRGVLVAISLGGLAACGGGAAWTWVWSFLPNR